MKRLILLTILVALGCKKIEHKKETDNELGITDFFDAITDDQNKAVFVVAHRGDWRNAPENSLKAIENCIEMGVDMVEIDVRMTKDSVLVLMHDETIDRTTTGKGKVSDWTLDSLKTLTLRNGANHPTHHKIPTLDEAMIKAKKRILVNLDKCYPYFDKVYKVLEKTGTTDQVLMKGFVNVDRLYQDFGSYLDNIQFMPIVDLGDKNAWQKVQEYQSILNPIAFEFIFSDTTSLALRQFESIRKHGSGIWVNTLWESLNAGYEDDMALHNPDSIYGWHLRKGVNILQTDRPQFLLEYLRKKEFHD